ncbi:sigma-70 family RNA polymerase sigma factor [uncultured Martelella sp.]|uniref:sigma-70 family RNA polymerase sigma factor n=1 Tax=uncultured Martelella sp. TaxID=392331 RepID=UPI0029C990AA|nr:sigma-70 family RNA polymerase sigma factor [uncultured Martelella sp.]
MDLALRHGVAKEPTFSSKLISLWFDDGQDTAKNGTFQRIVLPCGCVAFAEHISLMKKFGRLTDIYLAERMRLNRLANRILGNWEDAEDVTQEAFAKLQKSNVEPDGPGIFVRTIRNLAIDRLRAADIRRTHAQRAQAVEEYDAPSPDRIVTARQELEDLFTALQQLPRRRQQIFLLNRLDGMRHAEIARQLGISVSTVEKELRSALEFCQRWREERNDD